MSNFDPASLLLQQSRAAAAAAVNSAVVRTSIRFFLAFCWQFVDVPGMLYLIRIMLLHSCLVRSIYECLVQNTRNLLFVLVNVHPPRHTREDRRVSVRHVTPSAVSIYLVVGRPDQQRHCNISDVWRVMMEACRSRQATNWCMHT